MAKKKQEQQVKITARELVVKSIDELVPYANNAKIHSPEQVAKIRSSLREFGFVSPVLIDETGNIIAGHGRVMAARAEGMTEVPCVLAEGLSEAQRKAYILADNRMAEMAEWDKAMLKIELEGLDALDFGTETLGFDEEFLSDLFLDDGKAEENREVVEDEAPEIDEKTEPVSKLGDIWKLGRHRLMCGDSTKVEDVQTLTGGVQVDLLLTDPPYNVAYEGKTKEKLTIQNDSMENAAFRQFLEKAFAAADAVMKPGAVFCIWHADSEGYNFRGACADIGWKVRQCLIWNKNSMVMGRQDYHWKHEPCLYGWKEGAGHLWASDRKQTTVINWERPTKADIHPTMKPVGLFDYQIKNNTKGGDIVLDLFNGSGTTIVACEQNGRIAYAMELDPRYVDATIKRWETLTGEKAVLLNG